MNEYVNQPYEINTEVGYIVAQAIVNDFTYLAFIYKSPTLKSFFPIILLSSAHQTPPKKAHAQVVLDFTYQEATEAYKKYVENENNEELPWVSCNVCNITSNTNWTYFQE